MNLGPVPATLIVLTLIVLFALFGVHQIRGVRWARRHATLPPPPGQEPSVARVVVTGRLGRRLGPSNIPAALLTIQPDRLVGETRWGPQVVVAKDAPHHVVLREELGALVIKEHHSGLDVAIAKPASIRQALVCLRVFGWLDEEPDIDLYRLGLAR